MKKIFPHVSIRLFVVASGLCVLFSTSGLSQNPAADDIHRVDFRNFRYYPRYLNKVAVKTTNGSYTKQEDGYTVTFEIKGVTYGDLNGDGMDEAVVLTVLNGGGSGWFSEGFIYTMRNGKPAMLSRIAGGDRAAGGIRGARIENGLLKVERLESKTGVAVGADFTETTTHRLSESRLLQVGRPRRRSLRGEDRAKPIQFKSGQNSAVLTGTTSGADFYVLKNLDMRKSLMTVSVSSPLNNARFELINDDFTVAYHVTKWSGELGHYYIVVVSNGGSANYKLKVTVR
jgi:hypothetical protein